MPGLTSCFFSRRAHCCPACPATSGVEPPAPLRLVSCPHPRARPVLSPKPAPRARSPWSSWYRPSCATCRDRVPTTGWPGQGVPHQDSSSPSQAPPLQPPAAGVIFVLGQEVHSRGGEWGPCDGPFPHAFPQHGQAGRLRLCTWGWVFWISHSFLVILWLFIQILKYCLYTTEQQVPSEPGKTHQLPAADSQ